MVRDNRDNHIIYCNCAYYDIIPQEKKREILTLLQKSNMDITVIPDFCGMAAERNAELREILGSNQIKIIACYPRAVRWLSHAAGIELDEDRVEILNVRELTIEEMSKYLYCTKQGNADLDISDADPNGSWIPWFPVIDYSRCKNCKQCASFCLFGVYQINSDDNVIVANPQNCKTNCPACARICPEAAIMFPKIKEAPINGAEIANEQEVRAMIQLNVDTMLGDDVYAALAERRRKAQKIQLRKQATAQALSERDKFLK